MAIEKKFIEQFIKVSTKAALASSYMVGKKDKNAADQAAVDSMRSELNKIDMTAEVVIGEGTLDELFEDVRKIHFKSYLRYFYFNLGRISYLQANVLSAYVFLAPAIVAGVVTLGVMQQIIRAFGRVEGSMQYLLKAWPTIIELASVYKRLREFEDKLKSSEEDVTIESK